MKHIQYTSYRNLPREMTSAAEKLISTCSKYDKTEETINIAIQSTYTCVPDIHLFYTAYSGKSLIGFLYLFIPTADEAEVSGFVHPSYRRKGVCTQLLKTAEKELKEKHIRSMLFVCNSLSGTGKTVIEHLGAVYEFTEHNMRRDPRIVESEQLLVLRETTQEDIDKLVSINSRIFDDTPKNSRAMLENIFNSKAACYEFLDSDQPIGMGCLSVSEKEKTIFLFGFGILPDYRSKGYGKTALLALLNVIQQKYAWKTELEVNDANFAAVALYKMHGFKIITSYNYYRRHFY